MSKIILYHGSPNKFVTPKYGFYLAESKEKKRVSI